MTLVEAVLTLVILTLVMTTAAVSLASTETVARLTALRARFESMDRSARVVSANGAMAIVRVHPESMELLALSHRPAQGHGTSLSMQSFERVFTHRLNSDESVALHSPDSNSHVQELRYWPPGVSEDVQLTTSIGERSCVTTLFGLTGQFLPVHNGRARP